MMPGDPAGGCPFGWHGLDLTVPRGWELCAYAGNALNGHLALDDGTAVRLQLRWRGMRKTSGDPASMLEQYRRTLTRTHRQLASFHILGPAFLPKRMQAECEVLPYMWTAQQTVYGLIAHCASCRRVIFLELFFSADQVDRRLARRVFSSFFEHHTDDDSLWSVYGLAFRMPSSFALSSSVLVPGKLQFVFQDSGDKKWLRLERWTTATTALETLPLARWPVELLAAARLGTGKSLQLSDGRVGAWNACTFSTEFRRGMWMRPRRIEGIVWRDPEVRKVFGIYGVEPEPGFLQHVAESVLCY